MTSMPKVLVVDGNIAAGKSTFLSLLEDHFKEKGLKVCVVDEPVKTWEDSGILKEFYKNPIKYAYMFQSYVFVSRINAAIEMYEKYRDDVDVYILERSWFTDRLFAKVNYESSNIDEIEYTAYKYWADFHQKFAPFQVSGFLYLRCDPNTSYQRCLARHRDGECDISPEYLRDLLKEHDTFFNKSVDLGNGTSSPVLTLNSSENFITDMDVRQRLFQTIDSFYDSL